MVLENAEIVVDAATHKNKHRRLWRRREGSLKSIGRHVASELVIIPKEPTQDLGELVLAFSAK